MENIKDKLAENIHEMWAMGKIESGWSFGERRDDTMGHHPCLTQFQNLPTAEKRYNVQLALQTLRSVGREECEVVQVKTLLFSEILPASPAENLCGMLYIGGRTVYCLFPRIY